MKTAVSMPDELFSAADKLAQKLGLSRSQLYQRAIREFLTQQGQDAVTNALNVVYEDGNEASKLDPAIGYLQGASLIHDGDEDEW